MQATAFALALSLALGPIAITRAPAPAEAPEAGDAENTGDAAAEDKPNAAAEDEPAPPAGPDSDPAAQPDSAADPNSEPAAEPDPAAQPDSDPAAEPDSAAAPGSDSAAEPDSAAQPDSAPAAEPPPPGGDTGFVAHSTKQGQLAPPAGRDRLGCEGSKSCRRMSIAGIVVGSLGLAGVGVGIGLLVNRDRVIPESPIYVTSTRPPGLVSVTVCSGVTLTAVLMLVAAHRGYKERGLEQARVRVVPGGLRF